MSAHLKVAKLEFRLFWKCLGLMTALLWSGSVFAQKLRFKTIEPVRSELCQLNSIGLKLYNDGGLAQTDVLIELSLPDGINYEPGSLSGAFEFNITQLSKPIFIVSELKASDSISLWLKVFNTCLLTEAINNAQTFNNKWIIKFGSETDSISSPQNYSIETPYLVISDVVDQTRNIGDKFQRKITITNTRLGALSNFIFEDYHDHLKISSASGKTLNENLNYLGLEFNSEHFKSIGDLDSLFERDEQIEIIENIEHDLCIPELIHSNYLTSWFCSTDTCQKYLEASTIEFITPVALANIKVSSNSTAPGCICQSEGSVQTLSLTNTGSAIADDITVDLASSLLNTLVPYGIIPGSVKISGDAVLLDLSQTKMVNMADCTPVDAYQYVSLKLSPLAPGQSVQIEFNYVICSKCAPLPGSENYSWYYSYTWNTRCVNNSEQKRMNLKKDILFTTTTLKITPEIVGTEEKLLNKKDYIVNCNIEIPKVTNDQNLYLSINLPCPLRLKDSLFYLNGRLPDEISILGDSSYNIKLVYYPFLEQNLDLQFTIIPDSTFLCNLNNALKTKTEVISSCPFKQKSDYFYLAQICFTAQLSCPGRAFDCGPCANGIVDIELDYEKGDFINDSIYTYLEGNVAIYRKNIGLKDDDNDRMQEQGLADLDKIKTKNFITKDTIVFDFNLSVVKEDPRFTYDSISLIIGNKIEFDTLFSEISIIDESNGNRYTSVYPVSKEFLNANPIPNCINTIIYRKNEIGGYNIPLTVDSLNAYGATLPPDFHFDSGDSINVSVIGKISSVARDRIIEIEIPCFAVIEDRQNIRSEPYSCIKHLDTIYLATLGIEYTQSNEAIYLCDQSKPLLIARIEGSNELNNFFCYEYRALYHLEEINFLMDNEYFEIDSIRVEYLNEDSLGQQLIYSSRHLPGKFKNKWTVNPNELEQFSFDESFVALIYVYGQITDCKKYDLQSKTMISSFTIQGSNGNEFYIPTNFLTLHAKSIFSKPNELSIYNGFKELNISNKTLFNRSGRVSWTALISDLEQEGGFDFWIWSPSNTISDLKLDANPDVVIERIDSFTLRLNGLKEFNNYSIQFSARFKSCKKDTIYLISKWYCGIDSVPVFNSCIQDTAAFYLIPEMAELELDLMQESFEVDLCDTLPEIVLEFYNADKGSAFLPEIYFSLPEGTQLLLNECYFSYPKGSPLSLLPQPVQLSGQSFVWKFIDFIQSIKADGLKGIEEAPFNSIELFLKIKTNCNALVNSFPVFRATAMNDCGIETNSVQKNGKLIQLKNVSGEPNLSMSLSVMNSSHCVDTIDLDIDLWSSAVYSTSDSLKIILPPELNYLNNSSFNIYNAPFSEPKLYKLPNENVLVFSFPDGINVADSSKFRIRLFGFRKLTCQDSKIRSVAFKTLTAWCSSSNMFCDVKVQKGSATWDLPKKYAGIVFDTFQIQHHPDSSTILLISTMHLLNKELLKDSLLRLGIYLDFNSNGILDAGDSLYTIINKARNEILGDSSFILEIPLSIASISHCSWLMTALSTECYCSNDTIAFVIPIRLSVQNRDSICSGESIQLGVNAAPEFSYHWEGLPGLCDSCNKVQIYYPLRFDLDSNYIYTLTTRNKSGCVLTYQYTITVYKNPAGNFIEFESCPGDLIEVDAGDRIRFKWHGEGIADPESYFQSYSNVKEQYWFLDFTDENNCPARDSFHFIPLIDSSVIYLIGDTIIDKGKSTKICVIGGKRWKWDNDPAIVCQDCACNEIEIEEDRTFGITVWDLFDCPHRLNINLHFRNTPCDEHSIFVPNAFSPNGDMRNDVLYVHANNLSGLHFVIYNRWGEKMFESFDLYTGWDGTLGGKALTPDVFAYFLEADCTGGQKIIKKGNISLLK